MNLYQEQTKCKQINFRISNAGYKKLLNIIDKEKRKFNDMSISSLVRRALRKEYNID